MSPRHRKTDILILHLSEVKVHDKALLGKDTGSRVRLQLSEGRVNERGRTLDAVIKLVELSYDFSVKATSETVHEVIRKKTIGVRVVGIDALMV